jgi:hypothetical protein
MLPYVKKEPESKSQAPWQCLTSTFWLQVSVYGLLIETLCSRLQAMLDLHGCACIIIVR